MEFLKSMNWIKFSCLPGDNSSFYSCVLSDLALYWKRGRGDLVLIQTSLLFICRSCCSYAKYFAFTYEKR